jgi:DNA-binding PucR family transcriptional regulator
VTTQTSRGRHDESAILRQLALAVDDATIEGLAERMVEAMCAAVPEVAADPDLQADALAATRASGRQFLASLQGDAWIPQDIPTGLANMARTIAARRLDVTVLIKLARLAQNVYWAALMEVVELEVEDPAARRHTLATVYQRFGRFLEDSLDGAAAVFQEERDRRMRGAQARREEAIKALLDDDEIEIERASRVLGYDLRRCHTALVLWGSGSGHEPLDQLESFARDFAGALDTRQILTTASGSQGLWAWIGTDRPPGAEQRDQVSGLELPPGLRAAVGQSGIGRDGFSCSHSEALSAQRLALSGHADDPVIWYADVEIVSLLSQDSPGMRALVRRELAGLAHTGIADAKLRQTALAYLKHGCSATAAARDLGAHKNTIRYRMAQVEEALGRPLQGQELRLQLALMVVEALGDELLNGAGVRQHRSAGLSGPLRGR